ncbi:hypothetical protein T492DRAFT_886790 [Pavlovales sp. CCMP2436]|nr:hypothetical protein T492DRAFT_886790 [Pavlovales sp. CCMP2436]
MSSRRGGRIAFVAGLVGVAAVLMLAFSLLRVPLNSALSLVHLAGGGLAGGLAGGSEGALQGVLAHAGAAGGNGALGDTGRAHGEGEREAALRGRASGGGGGGGGGGSSSDSGGSGGSGGSSGSGDAAALGAAFRGSRWVQRQEFLWKDRCPCETAFASADVPRLYAELPKVLVIDLRDAKWNGLGNSLPKWVDMLRFGTGLGWATFLLMSDCAIDREKVPPADRGPAFWDLPNRRAFDNLEDEAGECQFDLGSYFESKFGGSWRWDTQARARVHAVMRARGHTTAPPASSSSSTFYYYYYYSSYSYYSYSYDSYYSSSSYYYYYYSY